MKLSDVIRRECVQVSGVFEDKAMVLCEIAALARKSPLCRNVPEETILEALQERETLGSTAFGCGVAIPHCRLKNVRDFVVGLVTIPDGVDFEAADHKKVQLIIFIIAPVTDNTTHIRLLSSISQALQDSASVKKMINAKSEKALCDRLIQAAEKDIPVYDEDGKKNLLSVMIQDRVTFDKILPAMAGVEGCSVSVIDAKNSHSCLKSIPLFAAIHNDTQSDFCRMILTVVERRLTNEMIRRIETVTGSLSQCSGVLLTVQELSFCAGVLEP
jgi:PTS system nitrogen regulatory IIA component